jgi:hypothetical protein
MSPDNDLGAELLKQNGGPGGPQHGSHEAMVQQVVAQSRRRVRLWGWAAAILWAIVGVHLFVLRVATLFVAYFIVPMRLNEGRGYPNTFWLASNIAAMIWPMLLCAAALSTMKFILVSRRATLRQIQAELACISAQVKRLVESAKA